MADNPVTTIDDVRRFLRGKDTQEAPGNRVPLPPMADDERAEYQRKIATLVDENASLRAQLADAQTPTGTQIQPGRPPAPVMPRPEYHPEAVKPLLEAKGKSAHSGGKKVN